MGIYTHALEYDGGVLVSEITRRTGKYEFANPVHHFNGEKPWALMLAPLPPGMGYDDVMAAGTGWTEYIQAAGSDPDTITVQIRRPGGAQWDVQWVRYIVGHPHDAEEPPNVPIKLPRANEMVTRFEVFDADEATELFWTYFKTGDIPADYSLRPIDGYTTEGAIFDVRDGTPRLVAAGKSH